MSHFPSHVGQAGLRGEREPEGTTVRLKLDEAQVNGIYVQVCWSLGFTRQRKQFQREVWRASIPRADSLIPKVKFLSRGDNKDTYAVQTSFKRVLGTLRFYATYLNSKCQGKNLERLQASTNFCFMNKMPKSANWCCVCKIHASWVCTAKGKDGLT